LQKDQKNIPVRFDFDIKKLFYKVENHWEDFYYLKEAQTKYSGHFDPNDPQNFSFTFDHNDDFGMLMDQNQ